MAASELESGRIATRLRVGLCVVVVLVLGCCVMPMLVLRPDVDVNTFYPQDGMSADELLASYGPPSSKTPGPNGTTTWVYTTGRFGLGGAICVNIDAAGRVESSYNH